MDLVAPPIIIAAPLGRDGSRPYNHMPFVLWG